MSPRRQPAAPETRMASRARRRSRIARISNGGARFGWTDANAPDPVEIRQELEEIRRLLGHDS